MRAFKTCVRMYNRHPAKNRLMGRQSRRNTPTALDSCLDASGICLRIFPACPGPSARASPSMFIATLELGGPIKPREGQGSSWMFRANGKYGRTTPCNSGKSHKDSSSQSASMSCLVPLHDEPPFLRGRCSGPWKQLRQQRLGRLA